MNKPLRGIIPAPPDKSITHRALFFAALNHGRTRIIGPSLAADCTSTLELLRAVGYDLTVEAGSISVRGGSVRVGGDLLSLDCGNSGTTARMAMGFLTGEQGRFRLTGDRSLLRRPMERVAAPLRALGGDVESTDGRLPVTVFADGDLPGVDDLVLDVASAQVHSALALAALRSRHGVLLRRTAPMRDHTLRLLGRLGAIRTDGDVDRIVPQEIDDDLVVRVPGDISGAAFPIVAAILVPGSNLTLSSVGLNPTRISLLRCLRAMGADIEWHIRDEDGGEPSGDVVARYSPELRGIELTGDDLGDGGSEGEISVAEMMDELPLLALVAAAARGRTIVRGAAELRLKESDRIAATVGLLRGLGVTIDELDDGFELAGPQPVLGGVEVNHFGDHRLCMAAGIAALIAVRPVRIADSDAAAVSYPRFWEHLASVGGGGLGLQ